jgi:hypothetical protein
MKPCRIQIQWSVFPMVLLPSMAVLGPMMIPMKLNSLVVDAEEEIENIDVVVEEAMDAAGNNLSGSFTAESLLDLDTKNPSVVILSASEYNVTTANDNFSIVVLFDEEMDQTDAPSISFPVENPSPTLTYNGSDSEWLTSNLF